MKAVDGGDGACTFTTLRQRLLTGVSCAALAVACLLPPQAGAGNYTASNETELRQAIDNANADPDPNATITLTADITVSDPTVFPAFTKPVTIRTGPFTLAGDDIASGAGNGISLTFSGGDLLTSGAVEGGSADTNPDTGLSGLGGVGVALSNGSLTNTGAVAGGAGGGRFRSAAGAGGVGADLTNSTLVNQGSVVGGAGGVNSAGSGASAPSGRSAGAGGAGVAMVGGALDNQGAIIGGDGGDSINTAPNTDNFFGGPGGVGAQLSGGNHVNSSTGSITGGKGGTGRNSVGGAGSGPGGAGVVLSDNAIFVNNGVIAGGEGTQEAHFTRGSAGGDGVVVANSRIVNNGTIAGGDGEAGTSGAGGVGVAGNGGAMIVNAGTISGGLRDDIAARQNAISFTNGNNRLELHAGSTVIGNVLAGAGDTLGLGGSTNSSFDVSQIGPSAQYRNFGTYEKTGTSTWTLTGTTATVTPWTLLGGTLQISSDANLGAASGGLTFNGGTLQNTAAFSSVRSVTVNAGGGTFRTDADLSWSGVIGGSGPLTKTGAAKLDLTGDSSGFSGTTSVETGTLAVNGGLCGAMNVLAGGRLQGTGTVCDTTNAGTIAPGNSIGTLLVDGDYVGTGGTLEMEAVLNGTGSPADRLVITGNASGTTTINVINLGGTGAATGSGNTDGISIAQVGGTSAAGTFRLQGGYVAAGPYQYGLTAFAPGSSAASEADPLLNTPTFWDYRLQSLTDASGNPVPVPQLGAYQSLPSGALRYGASLLDSLHERLGEIQHLTAYRAAEGAGDPTGEAFLRGKGWGGDVSGDKGPDYNQDIWFVQFGGNVVGWDIGDRGATLRGGAAISVGGSDLDVKGSSASVDLNGTSLALTTTYQAFGGWYVDAVAQGTRYNADVRTSERGETGNPDGWGWGLSAESGYPVDLGSKLILEPQAQLAYQEVSFDEFTDVDGITVDLKDDESLRGRLGARAQKTFAAKIDRETTLWSPYVEVNALHEFLDGDSITAGGVPFESDNGGTSVRFGGGLNAQLGPQAALFTNISYEKGLTNGAADAWSGSAGLRLNF